MVDPFASMPSRSAARTLQTKPDSLSASPASIGSGSAGAHGDPASSGPLVLGDFELRREIGRGGMGTVYEAWQRSLQRVVALKVLARHISATPKAIIRFQREAQAAAKLHHTHIVPIFAQGEVDGNYFYAMEFIEGSSLNHLIGDLRADDLEDATTVDLAETVAIAPRAEVTPSIVAGGRTGTDSHGPSGSTSNVSLESWIGKRNTPFFFSAVADHIANVADALDYAHQRSVIHRDIKPHNLVLGVDGRLRVLDFGLARLAEQPGVTITGELLGSPLYMSPEQITGNPDEVDHRSDIYSLGATLYEWLTLSPPYPGETRERVIGRILSSEAASIRTHNAVVPLDLETICMKAIERNREKRYQTAGEMRDDLRRFVGKRPIVAKRIGFSGRTFKFIARHQLASLAVAAAVIALSLTWGLYAKNRTAKHEAQAAAQARESQELVLDLIGRLPIELRAPLRAVEAAVPMAQGVAQSDQAGAILQGLGAGDSQSGPTVGTPASLVRRLALEFYDVVAPRNWQGLDGADEAAAHLREAAERWKSGDREASIQILNGYLEAKPDDFDARQFHAILCAQLGQYDKMAEDADHLVNLRGDQTSAYLWRSVAHFLSGRVEASLEDLSRAAAIDAQSVWVKVLRGLALIQAGRSLDALAYFEEALRSAPDSVVARLGRAVAETSLGRNSDAVADASEVIRGEPDNADALTIRGDGYNALSDFAAAAKDFEKAMSIAGRTPALGLRYLSALVRQRSAAEAKPGELDLGPDGKPRAGSADPDEDGSRGPLFDWLSRKVRPRPGGRDGR